LVLPFAVACYALGANTWKKLGAWTAGLGFLAMFCTQSVGGLIALAFVFVLAIFCFVGTGTRGGFCSRASRDVRSGFTLHKKF